MAMLVAWAIILMLLPRGGHHTGLAEGCLTLHGQTPDFSDYGSVFVGNGFNDQNQVISRDLQFSCNGSVTGWAAYIERSGTFITITFQVWRPLTQSNNCNGSTFQLVGSHTFNNTPTDSTNLLNISSVEDSGHSPIVVQPGDVVGFYADYDGNRRVSVQSDRATDSVSYYASGMTSASTGTVNTCQDLTSTEQGAPVITAYVTVQDPNSTTTQSTPTLATTDSATTQSMISNHTQQQPATTTETSISPTSSTNEQINTKSDGNFTSSTTPEQDESTTGPNATEPNTTTEDGGGIMTTTKSSTDEESLEQEGTKSLPIILSISIVVALVAGIAIVGAFLMIGWCVCKRTRKQRRLDLNSLSIASPMDLIGSRDRADSHIYCEVGYDEKKREHLQSFSDLDKKKGHPESFSDLDTKRGYLESFSDLDNKPAFDHLDCSCKIPSRVPSSDYEVPVTTLERSKNLRANSCIKGGKEDFERTYETPMDAKMRYERISEDTDGSGRERVDSLGYAVPRPIDEEEEYTQMASVPRGALMTVKDEENIYENDF